MSENGQSGHRVGLASPDIGDEERTAVADVLRSPVLTNGPRLLEFEAVFAERHAAAEAVAFTNGTSALTAIWLALGIGPGDEVIVPSLTFISSATSVCHVGAMPVFADVHPDTLTLDPRDVAGRVSSRTRAILPVHYGGQAADLDDLRTVADDAGVALVEDAAQAHGASYRGRPVGTAGRAAMFSFTPTKNITTGEGGMVTTDDPALAETLRLLRNHGQTSRYRHELLGHNWRMGEMQAAIGVVQVGKLDAILERKRANAAWMTERLRSIDGVTPPAVRPDRDHVFMLYTLTVRRGRDALLQHLEDEGIEARVYFPPVHRQPIFADTSVDLPVTDDVTGRILSVPMHSRMSAGDLERVAAAIESGAASSGGDPTEPPVRQAAG